MLSSGFKGEVAIEGAFRMCGGRQQIQTENGPALRNTLIDQRQKPRVAGLVFHAFACQISGPVANYNGRLRGFLRAEPASPSFSFHVIELLQFDGS